jgi:hypothetical protein
MHSPHAGQQPPASAGRSWQPAATACPPDLDKRSAPKGVATNQSFVDAEFDAPSDPHTQGELRTEGATGQSDRASDEWSEDEIVLLHWRLLQEIRHLADPATPLEEKLDTLRWVFTEREKDGLPFSFVNCLRVVGCSPLSPIAYCGLVDAEDVRERIRHGLKPWLHATLARYPDRVREAVATHPEWVEARLTRNPRWTNEQLKQLSVQGDLFA